MIKKTIRKILVSIGMKKSNPMLQGEDGIRQMGHRKYVGGLWEEMGELQFNFLKGRGLKPNHVFLDIACGSLRAGVHLIPYLDKGNYLGVDKEKSLIDLGLKTELKPGLLQAKAPEFLISNQFDFGKLSKVPDYAIAQSLFTHLPPKHINECFQNLKKHFHPKGVFFATYFLSDKKVKNPKTPHDHGVFKYTLEEIKEFGSANGWNCHFIGDWNHPRNQQIVQYTPRHAER